MMHQPDERPRRLAYGLMAWQATVGYISVHHSPDVLLNIQVYPHEGKNAWSALVSWGQKLEFVRDLPSMAAALDALWQEVNRNHQVFQTPEASGRSPVGYGDDEWVDVITYASLNRLIMTTSYVFTLDWSIIIVYQPTDNAAARVQMRLLAKENAVVVGGRGPTLLDASSDLFRNAIPAYARHSGYEDEIAGQSG